MPDDTRQPRLTADQCRERAKLVRNLAEGVGSALLRQDLIEVASEYERGADMAESGSPIQADNSAKDQDEHTGLSDRPRRLATREYRASEQHWRVEAHSKPARWPERRTARASWARSILIIAGLSMLAWAVLILIVIAVRSAL